MQPSRLDRADRGPAGIAPILMIGADEDRYLAVLAHSLAGWWSLREAALIADAWSSRVLSVETKGAPLPAFPSDTIRALIEAGERSIRIWA